MIIKACILLNILLNILPFISTKNCTSHNYSLKKQTITINDNIKIATLFRQKEDKLSGEDQPDYFLLYHAIIENNPEQVRTLLANNANLINDALIEDTTPLNLAILHEATEIVRILLANNANPSSQDRHGQSPLHIAAINNDINLINRLAQHGAQLDIKNNDNKLPQDYARRQDVQKLFIFLKEQKESIYNQKKTCRENFQKNLFKQYKNLTTGCQKTTTDMIITVKFDQNNNASSNT